MSSSNSVLERNVQRICAKLKAIAQLDFGDKWNSTTRQAEPDTPYNKLWRTVWYWKEGKDNSVIDFKIIFEEAFTIIDELLNLYPLSDDEYQSQLAIWIRDLTEQIADTKMAMIRQKGTYAKYTKTINDLDEIMKYINTMSDKIARQVKENGVVLTNPITIESISPSRFNSVHIPMVKGRSVEKDEPKPVEKKSYPNTPVEKAEPPIPKPAEKKDNMTIDIDSDLELEGAETF